MTMITLGHPYMTPPCNYAVFKVGSTEAMIVLQPNEKLHFTLPLNLNERRFHKFLSELYDYS